jgi:hypothetical protein
MPRAKKETLTPEQENKKVKDEWLAKPIDVQPNVSEPTDGKKSGLVDRFAGMFSGKEEGVDDFQENESTDNNGMIDSDRPDLLTPKPSVDVSPLTNLLTDYVKAGDTAIDQGKRLIGHETTTFKGKVDTKGNVNAKIDRKRRLRSGWFG